MFATKKYQTSKPILKVLTNKQILNPKPLWFMRQAGRYLPEYRELRSKWPNFIDFCLNPNAVVDASMQPLKRYPKIDASIIFSDILLIPYALGQDVRFDKNHGPVLGHLPNLNLSSKQIHKLLADKLANVEVAINMLSKKIRPDQTLIGFIGAPFTLMYYMYNTYSLAKKNSHQLTLRQKIQNDKKLAKNIIDKLIIACSFWAKAQIKAGAEVIMIFESWAKLLDDLDSTNQFSISPIKTIAREIKEKYDVPIIVFAKSSRFLPLYSDFVDCLAIDHNQDIAQISKLIPKDIALMGNLDPKFLVGNSNSQMLSKTIDKIITDSNNRPFIFNLGHGIDKRSNPEILAQVILEVKNRDIINSH